MHTFSWGQKRKTVQKINGESKVVKIKTSFLEQQFKLKHQFCAAYVS